MSDPSAGTTARQPEITGIDDVLAAGTVDGSLPGIVAAVAESDTVLYQGASGWSDIGSRRPMTGDTICLIASMTKPVTSVAVMQLVEQGAIELDRAVADYMPRFAAVQVFEGFDAAGRPILRPPRSAFTVRQLLTHTAGYVNEIWDAALLRYAELGYVPSRQAGGDGFLDYPLVFDPGTSWRYSIATDVLGVLVETISGLSIDRYFETRIFAPLGMRDTFFRAADDRRPDAATVYARADSGTLRAAPGSRPGNTFLSGGGGLSSTAGDYLRFVRMLLRGGELDGARILESATVARMAENQVGSIAAQGPERAALPALSNDFDLVPDADNRFGLGFLIYGRDRPGAHAAGTLTWGGLYNTWFWIDRARDLCGVWLTQLLPFCDARALAAFDRFERAAYRAFRGGPAVRRTP